MSDSDILITFDGPADVWRVQRGDASVEISIVEMTDEYYRWQREGRGSSSHSWQDHAKEFCRRRLEAHTRIAGNGNNHLVAG